MPPSRQKRYASPAATFGSNPNGVSFGGGVTDMDFWPFLFCAQTSWELAGLALLRRDVRPSRRKAPDAPSRLVCATALAVYRDAHPAVLQPRLSLSFRDPLLLLVSVGVGPRDRGPSRNRRADDQRRACLARR